MSQPTDHHTQHAWLIIESAYVELTQVGCTDGLTIAIAKALADAEAQEREACAAIADTYSRPGELPTVVDVSSPAFQIQWLSLKDPQYCARTIALLIRQRGGKTP